LPDWQNLSREEGEPGILHAAVFAVIPARGCRARNPGIARENDREDFGHATDSKTAHYRAGSQIKLIERRGYATLAADEAVAIEEE
jgi:hypothetical protein